MVQEEARVSEVSSVLSAVWMSFQGRRSAGLSRVYTVGEGGGGRVAVQRWLKNEDSGMLNVLVYALKNDDKPYMYLIKIIGSKKKMHERLTTGAQKEIVNKRKSVARKKEHQSDAWLVLLR